MNKKVRSSKFKVQSHKNSKEKATTLLLWILLMVASACAKKGPPIPLDSIVPMRIVDFPAIPREGRLLLEWKTPKENTDKTPLTDLVEFQILRSEGVLVGDECKGCGGKPKVVYKMKLGSQEEGEEKKNSALF